MTPPAGTDLRRLDVGALLQSKKQDTGRQVVVEWRDGDHLRVETNCAPSQRFVRPRSRCRGGGGRTDALIVASPTRRQPCASRRTRNHALHLPQNQDPSHWPTRFHRSCALGRGQQGLSKFSRRHAPSSGSLNAGRSSISGNSTNHPDPSSGDVEAQKEITQREIKAIPKSSAARREGQPKLKKKIDSRVSDEAK